MVFLFCSGKQERMRSPTHVALLCDLLRTPPQARCCGGGGGDKAPSRSSRLWRPGQPLREQFPSLLVSWVCHDEVPQTRWPKTTQLIFLQFWRSDVWRRFHWLKIKVLTGLCSLLEALGENLISLAFPVSRLCPP